MRKIEVLWESVEKTFEEDRSAAQMIQIDLVPGTIRRKGENE